MQRPAARGLVALIVVAALGLPPRSARAQACSDQTVVQPRPIPLGVSGGGRLSRSFTRFGAVCCTGTLGALVESQNGLTQYVLSNSHVIGRVNRAVRGELIVQPGLVDQSPICMPRGAIGHAVARFSKSIRIRFQASGKTNAADAAIARVVRGDVSPDILDIGPINGTAVTDPSPLLNAPVQKRGRTSCLTAGTMTDVSTTVMVTYPRLCNEGFGTAIFDNQIMVTSPTAFIQPGDSGSLLLTTETCPRALGLLFAGNDTGTMAFANPIESVLSGLNVKIVGGCASATAAADLSTFTTGSTNASLLPAVAAETVAKVAAVKNRHVGELIGIPGVVGAGVGAADEPGKARIDVMVEKDTPETRAQIPAEYDGIPVHVIESGEITAW